MRIHGRTPDSRGDAGFTLIEVMIAMTILGVGLLSIAVAQLTAMKVQSRSKNQQQAMSLAREQMDDIEALEGGSPFLSSAATTDDPNNPIQVGNDSEDTTRFTRRVTVTPNSPAAGTSLVVVRVSWNTPNGGTREVQLSTLKRMN